MCVNFIKIIHIFNSNKKSALKQGLKLVNPGFLLIECMISLVILSMFLTILAYYQSLSVIWQAEALHRIKAFDTAHSVLEHIRADQLLVRKKQIKHEDITIEWNDEDLSKTSITSQEWQIPPVIPSFKLLKLSISWHGRKGMQHASLIASRVIPS